MNRPAETGNNIDQVRDILFGAQMREYTGHLERLEAELSTLRAEIHDRIDQHHNTLIMELRVATEAIEKKLKSMDQSHLEEAEGLRQSVGQVRQKLIANTQQLDEEISAQISGVRRELLESKSGLQEAMRSVRTQVTESLEQHVAKLQNAKVSREDMAEALIELALRLKGTGVISELSSELSVDLNDSVFEADYSAAADTRLNGQSGE